jgi:small subunit ribosomal protein S9
MVAKKETETKSPAKAKKAEDTAVKVVKKVTKLAETKEKPAKVETPAAAPKAEKPKAPKKALSSDKKYATGKRKNAIARVFLSPGKGDFLVNGKKMAEYFRRPVLQMLINKPLELTKQLGLVNINATVSGGGLSGQAGALAHGITKSLVVMDGTLRSIVKPEGLLTRDSRVVER